jgi:hypothetical protein
MKDRMSLIIFMISECCGKVSTQALVSCDANGDCGMDRSKFTTPKSNLVGIGNIGRVSSVQAPPISTLR